MESLHEFLKDSSSLEMMLTGWQRSRSLAAFRIGDVFVWYWDAVISPKHSRSDLMLLNQERSRQICSERAAFTKLVGGCAIALFRYLIHSLMLPKIRGNFPVSPHAAQFADLLLTPKRYLR